MTNKDIFYLRHKKNVIAALEKAYIKIITKNRL